MPTPNEAIYLGPPQAHDVPGAPAPSGYLGAFTAIHRFPNWFVSTLLCGVCGFIPVVGPIVFVGYTMENIESLHRTNGQRFVPFDFNRFVDYLLRGIGPWLVLLGAWLAVSAINYGINTAMGWGLDLAPLLEAVNNPNGVIDVDAILSAIFLSIARDQAISKPLWFLLQPLIFALMLRGGLMRDVGQSFALGPALAMVGRTALSVWSATLLYVLIAIPLYLFAVVTCGIGGIFSDGYLTLVNAWLSFQIYRRHLARGGEPIPLKSQAMEAQVL